VSEAGEDSTSGDRQERLNAAERRIFDHPAHKAYLESLAFQRTMTVFTANLSELLSLLDQAATDQRLAVELIQNVHAPVVRDGFHALVAQRLHNYLAATGTIADHALRMKNKKAGDMAAEYDGRLTEMRKNPEVDFMRRLRDYTLHRELPFLSHTLTFNAINTASQSMVSEVELSVGELQQWDGWNTLQRDFLATYGDALPLRAVARRHGDLVIGFARWWGTLLETQNAAGIDELNELVVARNAVLSGDELDAARRRTDEVTARRADPPHEAR
jgi:hypothetical protein